MKLTLNVTHGNASTSMQANVGAGNGTVKWLSLMAAQRYAMLIPNGRLRNREQDTYIGSLTKPQLLPKHVYTDDIPFLHPDYVLNEKLKNGETVHVELYHDLPVNEYDTPIYSPFACIAFAVSDSKAELRQKLTIEKQQETKDFYEIRAKQKEEQRIASNRPKLQKMRNILMEQLRDENILTTTLTNVWTSIFNSGVLDALVPSSNEQSKIKQFFTTYYEEISQMYKYYSAVNSGGGTHTLEYIEFTKFLQETNIFQSLQSNIIIKLFGASPSTIHSEIILWEFFVSCIKIAVYKYITLPKKENAALKKRGQRAELGQGSIQTQSQALQQLYTEFLLPVIDRLPASTAIKKAMDSEDILLLIYDHLDDLTHVFATYSETNLMNMKDLEGIREIGMMNLQQFIQLSTDCDFLGPTIALIENNDKKEDESGISTTTYHKQINPFGDVTTKDITLKDIRQVFSASQHDTAMNDVELQFLEDDSHKETMVFPEYIEAIVRLGFLKYTIHSDGATLLRPTGNTQHFEFVRLAVSKVVSSSNKK